MSGPTLRHEEDDHLRGMIRSLTHEIEYRTSTGQMDQVEAARRDLAGIEAEFARRAEIAIQDEAAVEAARAANRAAHAAERDALHTCISHSPHVAHAVDGGPPRCTLRFAHEGPCHAGDLTWLNVGLRAYEHS